MLDGTTALAVLYVAGVIWGLVRTDASPLGRVGLALSWPIGPLAFVVTVALLLVVSPLAFVRSATPSPRSNG